MSAFDSYQCVCECKTARKIFSLVFVILFIPTMNVFLFLGFLSRMNVLSIETFEIVFWDYNLVHEHSEQSRNVFTMLQSKQNRNIGEMIDKK